MPPQAEEVKSLNQKGDPDQDEKIILEPEGWRGRVIFCSCFYLLTGVSASTWGRFATIYYNGKGLSPVEIGIIEGCMPLVKATCQPIWGVIADILKAKKAIWMVTKLLNSAVLSLLAFPVLASGFINIMVISMGVQAFVCDGVFDAYALDIAEEVGKQRGKQVWTRMRMWLSVTWGLGSMAMGYINDEFGFEWNFLLYAFFSISSVLVVWLKVPERSSQERERAERGVSPDFGALLGILMTPYVLLFLVELIMFGMGIGCVERLLFIYLQNDLQAGAALCGQCVMMNVIIELPIFWYSTNIINTIGRGWCIALAQVCYFVRVWGYTLLTPSTVRWVLALEILHGVTFAFLWTSAVEFARKNSPEGWGATMQTLFRVAYYCFGVGVGAVLGGWAMETYGARWMYRMAAVVIFGVFCVRVAVMLTLRCWACIRESCFEDIPQQGDMKYDVLTVSMMRPDDDDGTTEELPVGGQHSPAAGIREVVAVQ